MFWVPIHETLIKNFHVAITLFHRERRRPNGPGDEGKLNTKRPADLAPKMSRRRAPRPADGAEKAASICASRSSFSVCPSMIKGFFTSVIFLTGSSTETKTGATLSASF
jgi:hypothetical protein